MTARTDFSLTLTGLPSEILEQWIIDFFDEGGVTVSSVEIDNSTSSAIVYFFSQDDQEFSLENAEGLDWLSGGFKYRIRFAENQLGVLKSIQL